MPKLEIVRMAEDYFVRVKWKACLLVGILYLELDAYPIPSDFCFFVFYKISCQRSLIYPLLLTSIFVKYSTEAGFLTYLH